MASTSSWIAVATISSGLWWSPVYTTSMPASRRARATILAPRSWPSSPGFPTRILSLRAKAPVPASVTAPPPLSSRIRSRERPPDLLGCRLDPRPVAGDHRPVEALSVPGEPRHQVEMEVRHRLERGGAVRLQQVETIGPDRLADGSRHPPGRGNRRLEIGLVRVVERGGVGPGND